MIGYGADRQQAVAIRWESTEILFTTECLLCVIYCSIIPTHPNITGLIIFSFTFTFVLVMDGSLPTSLKHIISNAEYYGPSLFLLGK